MTRSWVFTLPVAGTWYNIWQLILADPSNHNTPEGIPTDITFAYVPFLPKNVCTFKYASQNAITNPANGGTVTSFSFDTKNEGGVDLLSGQGDIMQSQNNDIVLDQISAKSTASGVTINVSVTVN